MCHKKTAGQIAKKMSLIAFLDLRILICLSIKILFTFLVEQPRLMSVHYFVARNSLTQSYLSYSSYSSITKYLVATSCGCPLPGKHDPLNQVCPKPYSPLVQVDFSPKACLQATKIS